MKLIFAISIVALSFFGTACRRSVGEMILVPMPQEATFTGGYFETDSARFVERAGDGYVACRIDPSAPEIRPEGYRLKVTRRGIDLTGPGFRGTVLRPADAVPVGDRTGDSLRGNHR